MNDFRFSPEDPRITAYALGELEGDDRAAVEAAMRRDPAVRAAVEQVRSTVADLQDALAFEVGEDVATRRAAEPQALAPVTSVSREEFARPQVATRSTAAYRRPRRVKKLLQFPQLYFVAAGFAAACFAIVVWTNPPRGQIPLVAKQYQEITLPPLPTAARATATEVAATTATTGNVIETAAPAVPAPTAPATVTAEPANAVASADTIQTKPTAAAAALIEASTPRVAALVATSANQPSTPSVEPTPVPVSAVVDVGGAKVTSTEPLPTEETIDDFGEPAGARENSPLLANGLGLLDQTTPAREERKVVYSFGPIDAGRSSVQTLRQSMTSIRSLPLATPLPRAPVVVDPNAKSPNTSKAAALRPNVTAADVARANQQSDALRLALQRATGSEAERARLVAEVQRAERIARETAAAFRGANERTRNAPAAPAWHEPRITMAQLQRAAAASGPAPMGRTDLLPGPRRSAKRLVETRGLLAATEPASGESYRYSRDNGFATVAQAPVSTFAADTDTASYANVRRFLRDGVLPPADAVRIEELLNYFPYNYAAPAAGQTLAASLEVTEAPWTPANRLVRIGVRAKDVAAETRTAANLVFVVDVSPSMDAPNKLPLLKESLHALLARLRTDDRVAIVSYAGGPGVVLPPTLVAQRAEIETAIERLVAGETSGGPKTLALAYEVAAAQADKGAITRVIFCTDGGLLPSFGGEGELLRYVEEKARAGLALSVLGVGRGDLKDGTLEALATKGGGRYGYVDTRREAEKALVEQMSSGLAVAAKAVKLQVEFNPAKVAGYRLIGYENRLLKNEDFHYEASEAGDLGSGQMVTALYEIVPATAEGAARLAASELKYQRVPAATRRADLSKEVAGELLTVRVGYTEIESGGARSAEFPLTDAGASFASASADFKHAAAVAAFGMILRDSPHRGAVTLGNVLEWAATAAAQPGSDLGGFRGEFIDLARQAQVIIKGE